MEDPYVLTGSALEKFEDSFDLIEYLLENQIDDDSLVFDLAWLPEPEHRQLFKDLAEQRQIGIMRDGKLHLSKPYTPKIIESFITYMGYGRPGMGTKYPTRERATPAQAAESYAKARNAMFKNFKKNFVVNIPRETLSHGRRKPRAVPPPIDLNLRRQRFMNTMSVYSNNNNNNSNIKNEVDPRMKIRINNNNLPNFGKMSGKKSAKYTRKGLPKNARSRKLKNWSRNKNQTRNNNNNKNGNY